MTKRRLAAWGAAFVFVWCAAVAGTFHVGMFVENRKRAARASRERMSP